MDKQKKLFKINFTVLLACIFAFVVICTAGMSAYYVDEEESVTKFKFDLFSPALTVTNPTGASADTPTYVTSDTVIVSGTVSDSGSGVKSVAVNGTGVTVNEDGSWSIEMPLNADDTVMEFTVTATDNVDKTSTEKRYAQKLYTITYNLNGGAWSGDEEPESGYTVDSPVTLPIPVKTGYTFNGWYESSDFSGSAVTQIAVGTAGNKTFYAKWTLNSYAYNVVYKSSTGVSLGSTTVSYNYGTTNTIAAPAKTGYTAPASQSVAWDSTTAKTITFTYAPDTYNITIDCNGGSGVSGSTYTIESEAITLGTPTRTGYTFLGWTGNNGTTAQLSVTIAKGSTGDKSYTANWSINKVLSSIVVTKAPDKISYGSGDDFDPTGMVVTATYSDGTSKAVDDYTITNGDNLDSEDQTSVTISYTENGVTVTTEQPINVRVLISIDSGTEFNTLVVSTLMEYLGDSYNGTDPNGWSYSIDNLVNNPGLFIQNEQFNNYIAAIIFGKTSDYADIITGLTPLNFTLDGCSVYWNADTSEMYFLSNGTIKFPEDSSRMFWAMHGLRKIVFGTNIDTSNVNDMTAMYLHCLNMDSIEGLENFNTSKVKSFMHMFDSCRSNIGGLTKLDLRSFDFSSATTTRFMFGSASSTKEIVFGKVNMTSNKDLSSMYSNAFNLETIYTETDWNIPVDADTSSMFAAVDTSTMSLVGGMGTTWDANYVDGTRARIDGGTDSPGYFSTYTSSTAVFSLLDAPEVFEETDSAQATESTAPTEIATPDTAASSGEDNDTDLDQADTEAAETDPVATEPSATEPSQESTTTETEQITEEPASTESATDDEAATNNANSESEETSNPTNPSEEVTEPTETVTDVEGMESVDSTEATDPSETEQTEN